MTLYAALLRGINVGGNNKLPMKDLNRIFAEAGCERVQTYIQSGNVVFDASPDLAASLPARIVADIAQTFGFHSPIVLRTRDHLADIFANNPFMAEGAPPAALHVLFLAAPPAAAHIDSLNPDLSPPDRFAVRGQDVYLYLPNGAARTKLTNAYFDSRLKTISTGRNWRTVTTLLAMMDG